MVEESILEGDEDALKQAADKSEEAMNAVASEFQVPGLTGF